MSWLPGGHTLPTALSWAVAVVVAVLLLIVVFKSARRIVHRLIGYCHQSDLDILLALKDEDSWLLVFRRQIAIDGSQTQQNPGGLPVLTPHVRRRFQAKAAAVSRDGAPLGLR